MMMLMRKQQQELTGGGGGGGGGKVNTWARACDTCGASPCRVYCRADGAYLCSGCDANVHAPHFRHERVPVCESCERAPAAFLCKADDASLCAACDADVHSANPLARRHHRVPILPLYGPSSAAAATGIKRGATQQIEEDEFDEEDEDEAASWLLPNPTTHADKGNKINPNDTNTNGYFLGADVDEYLDLVEYTSGPAGDNLQLSTDDHEPHFDSVVPAGISHLGLDLDFDIKSGFAYNNNNSSHFTQIVSVSSLDVGVVPESTMSEISTTNQQQQQPPKGTTIDLFSCHSIQQIPMQLSPMDREARVMRYREKKKTRKFEKTIRYASRKAYAETRPRIKGRFAKRINGADQVQIMVDGWYGVVPSF